MAQALTSLARNTAQHGTVSCKFCHIVGHFAKVCCKRRESNTSQTSSNAPTTTGKTGKTISSSHMATSFHAQGTEIRNTTSSRLATIIDDEKNLPQAFTMLIYQHGLTQIDCNHMAPICTIKFLSQTWNGILRSTRFTEQRPKPLPTL